MGKRSDFPRRKNDDYRTWDPRAVPPLLPHLMPRTKFVEPCAGDYVLAAQLEAAGHVCAEAYDIEPKSVGVSLNDALTYRPTHDFDCFVSNPPWTRAILHPLIVHLSDQAPTWLLFDSEWINSLQAMEFRSRLRRVVTVGRLKWIPDSPYDAMDSVSWYFFDRPLPQNVASVYLRTPRPSVIEAVAA